MPADPLTTVCLAMAIGIAAFIVGGRLRIPPIVPLLVFGMAAGPGFLGVVHPDSLGPEVMRSLVLGAVLVILFEGSLSLRMDSFRSHGGPITRLVTIGAAVTWLGSLLACHYVLGVPWRASVIIGAVVVVTGPTVVVPLLRTVRPSAKLREVLRWEGILIDPIGAIAAIVTFEFIQAGASATIGEAFVDYLLRCGVGVALGVLGGIAIDRGLRSKALVRRELSTPFALAVMLACAVGAEAIAHESSLFTAPVAGVVLAALAPPRLDEIERFNGEATTLLLAVLFTLLAASVDPALMRDLGWGALGLLGVLQLVRIACAIVSTTGTGLSWPERLFIGWMAPRGIVAASVASIFGAKLVASGLPGAEQIVPVTFVVIMGTVIIQGLLARRVGMWLGVLAPPQRNVVIAGATPFGVALALALGEAGIEAVVVDRNARKASWAEDLGALVYEGDVLSPATYADLDLDATGAYLASTSSDKVNGLAAHLASDIIGEEAVMQLPSGEHAFELLQEGSATMRSPLAFGERFTLASLNDALVRAGARIVVREVITPTTAPALRASLGSDFRPLVSIEARTGRPAFVRERGSRLRPGKVVGVEDLPPYLLAREQQSGES
jgi:NhaP-type Na+/H+ or K+/H+ antiporter